MIININRGFRSGNIMIRGCFIQLQNLFMKKLRGNKLLVVPLIRKSSRFSAVNNQLLYIAILV